MKSTSCRSVRSSVSRVKRQRCVMLVSCAALCIVATVNGCSDDPDDHVVSSSQALTGDGLVISQVWLDSVGSGPYSQNFVELFNRSAAPVFLGGLSVQSGAVATNFTYVNALPDVTVPPGGYFLMAFGAARDAGALLPAADFTAENIGGLGPAFGKLAIAPSVSALNCGGGALRCSADAVVDMIGWGGTVSDYEGTRAKSMNAPNALLRKGGGCVDTNNNGADFEVGTATPRNSATPVNVCPVDDPGTDGGAEAGLDSTADAGTDASFDASNDAGTPDAGGDASADSGVTDAGGDASSASGVGDGLVIGQIFYANLSHEAPYNQNFVELFNRSAEPVSLGGLSVQSGNNFSDFNVANALPDVTVPPGGYFLMAFGAVTDVGAPLPGADFTAPNNFVGFAPPFGKFAIARSVSALGCGGVNRCSADKVVDMIGWGAQVTDYEGTRATKYDVPNALLRKGGGCVDTNNNGADIQQGIATPRNSATPVNVCPIAEPEPDAGADAGLDAGTADAGTDASVVEVVIVPGTGGDASADSGVKDAGRGADSGVADAGGERDAVGSGSSTPPSSDPDSDTTDRVREGESGCSSSGRTGSPGTAVLTLGIVVASMFRRRRHAQSRG